MEGKDPATIIQEKGLGQISDTSEIEAMVENVMANNPELVERVKANPKAINALLGQVMRESQGKAKPDLVRNLLAKKL